MYESLLMEIQPEPPPPPAAAAAAAAAATMATTTAGGVRCLKMLVRRKDEFVTKVVGLNNHAQLEVMENLVMSLI